MTAFPSNIKIRNVIPYWRHFAEAVKLGEVVSLKDNISVPVIPIMSYIHDWESTHSIATGGDLISAAIMNGQVDLPIVKTVAEYLLERDEELSFHLKHIAQQVLLGKRQGNLSSYSIDALLDNRDDLIRHVRILKHYNSIYSQNPVAYVELAFYYSQLGNIEKARDMIEIALRIAPHQRFISRSAARFFMHTGEMDRAHYVLSHNESVKRDPWILASEIAVSTVIEKKSPYLKNGINLLSADISPYELSELGSAIGTVEMLYGSRKKARQAISIATKTPNDNGLAQAVWWARYYGETVDFVLEKSMSSLYEAQAIQDLFNDQYNECLTSAIKWLGQMPCSKRAVLFASEIAYTYTKEYETANKILNVGLKANPQDPVMLNNLAYSYALQGNVLQAEQTLKVLHDVIKNNKSIREQVCYDATCGLTEYRRGNFSEGAELYKKAIAQAIECKDDKLANLAMLNFIREEVRSNALLDTTILEHLDDFVCENQKEANQIKKDILEIFNSNLHNFQTVSPSPANNFAHSQSPIANNP